MSKKVGLKAKRSETKGKSPSTKPKGNFYHSMDSPVEEIIHLQRTIGNQAVQRLINSGTIQAKQVSNQSSAGTSNIESSVNSLKGGGHPLSESTRSFFEPRFGADFSQVRLHTDSRAAEAAKSVNAKAFTTGRNVVFGAGEYSPGTSSGRRLLAHELTHVVQQETSSSIMPMKETIKSYNGVLRRKKTQFQKKAITPTTGEWKWIQAQSCPTIKGGLGRGRVEGASAWRIYDFDYRSTKLKTGHKSYLDSYVIPFTKNKGLYTVKLKGHASMSGPARGNLALSKRRAESAENYLKTKLPSRKYIIVAVGEREPIDSKNKENCLDRGVVVSVFQPIPSPPRKSPEESLKRKMQLLFTSIYRRRRRNYQECNILNPIDLAVEYFCKKYKSKYFKNKLKGYRKECFEAKCISFDGKRRNLKWFVRREMIRKIKRKGWRVSMKKFNRWFGGFWKNRFK